MMFRTLPPTAAPVSFRTLLRGTFSSLLENENEARFRARLKTYFGVQHADLVSSGKAALYLSLRALHRVFHREEVILPAYSSFCLASAAARSGLSIRLCDVDPETLDFDFCELRTLVNENTLAVVAVHNYGLVCDMERIRNVARAKGACVVEDAAQAAGASFKGRKAGTMGEVGILSLGRGKNFCALGGGAILTDSRILSSRIEAAIEEYPRPAASASLKALAGGLGLSTLLHPERYALPSHLPFLDIGANIFDPSFEVARLPRLNAGVGEQTFSRLDEYNEIRISNARSLKERLNGVPGVAFPRSSGERRAVYLRFPILLEGRDLRDALFRRLHEKRLGASLSYPAPLNEISGFRPFLDSCRDFPQAKSVSRRILTLPTHPYLRESDLRRIVREFESPGGPCR
jgi:dTDP-4-amino-4,6-dideoxygalactose transaminase